MKAEIIRRALLLWDGIKYSSRQNPSSVRDGMLLMQDAYRKLNQDPIIPLQTGIQFP
jgi:hypothetical protein